MIVFFSSSVLLPGQKYEGRVRVNQEFSRTAYEVREGHGDERSR